MWVCRAVNGAAALPESMQLAAHTYAHLIAHNPAPCKVPQPADRALQRVQLHAIAPIVLLASYMSTSLTLMSESLCSGPAAASSASRPSRSSNTHSCSHSSTDLCSCPRTSGDRKGFRSSNCKHE